MESSKLKKNEKTETIFALSSGKLPSGIAVIRISGAGVVFALNTIVGKIPKPRIATLTKFYDPEKNQIIDEGICLFFGKPSSFTGEDMAEFHLHGGLAVVDAILTVLTNMKNFRLAEPGEFSLRAFENNKFDLTELEGFSDLINAYTQEQRKQAFRQSQGFLRSFFDNIHQKILSARALIEAELDFSDEEDIQNHVNGQVWGNISDLILELKKHLKDGRKGEIIRDGYNIVLLGPPNAGKSSLLNFLAQRDVAIVSSEAGTTRDIIEVQLDISGYAVSIVDTAGIRTGKNKIEKEGIRRALEKADYADLVFWLSPADNPVDFPDNLKGKVLKIISKKDLAEDALEIMIANKASSAISTISGEGIEQLVDLIEIEIKNCLTDEKESCIITSQRHRSAIIKALEFLEYTLETKNVGIEICAENLRRAGDEVGRITGKVDVEHLLDIIFSQFCVGK